MSSRDSEDESLLVIPMMYVPACQDRTCRCRKSRSANPRMERRDTPSAGTLWKMLCILVEW